MEPGISADRMQEVADLLRMSVSCSDNDAILDDLAFWDAMRGYDCFSPTGPTFIRVYAHPASVLQTLDEWRDTFNTDRAYVRGAHWYVIGPPSSVAAVRAPRSDREIPVPSRGPQRCPLGRSTSRPARATSPARASATCDIQGVAAGPLISTQPSSPV